MFYVIYPEQIWHWEGYIHEKGGPNFSHIKIDPKTLLWCILRQFKEGVFEKNALLSTPILAKKGHFWPPEGLFLAKNLENKVFSVHIIQNFPIWNPNVAPKKVTIFGPRDPPWPPQGVRGSQKWPKCIPSSPIMIINAKKAISGGSKILTYFFTRNVPACK